MQRIVNIQYLHNDNDTNIITNGYTIRKLHVMKNGYSNTELIESCSFPIHHVTQAFVMKI